MNKNDSRSQPGIEFTGLLTVALIVLKLIGQIDWDWVWVFSPIFISVLISLAVSIVLFIIALVEWVIEDRKGRVRK